jgi:hypothetical protein
MARRWWRCGLGLDIADAYFEVGQVLCFSQVAFVALAL